MSEKWTKDFSESSPATVSGTSGGVVGTSPQHSHSDHAHEMLQHDHGANTPAGGGAPLRPGTIFQFTGDSSDTSTGVQENFAPTNFSSNSVTRFNNASPLTIGGITGGADGRFHILYNQGSSTVTLKDNSAGSSSFNRIVCGGQDLILYPGMGVAIVYAASGSTVWHVIGSLVTPAKVTQEWATAY